MPKAGKYSYPFYTVFSVIEKLKTAYDTIHDYQMERSVIANALGMSETGGGFVYLLSALEDYGLTENREKKIILTDLGKRVLADDQSALQEAVLKVGLFRDIFNQYGQNVRKEQIEAFLRQKAMLDPLKAKELSSSLYRIYINMASLLIPAAGSITINELLPDSTDNATGVSKTMMMESQPEGILATIITKEGERLFIKDQKVLDGVYDAILNARLRSKKQEADEKKEEIKK